MLTKSQILTRSSVLLMRSASTTDGPMALQRSVQAVVTPNTMVGFQSRAIYTSSSEQEEDYANAVALPKQKIEEPKATQSQSQSESEEIIGEEKSSTEYSDSDLRDFKQEELKRQLYFKSRHEEYDPKTGAPILTLEETAELKAENFKMLLEEPIVRRKFDMAEYNDWKKEVDRETVRTQQKIEHYKRSEELLRAIQDRLSSVNDTQSEKELQNYLLSKLGYKNAAYTDFISNQMTQEGQQAKDEAKRASIIKTEDATQDLYNYNDKQVRDSQNLGFSTAWDKDAYTPSSKFDKAPYHAERKIMTQKEFMKSRTKDQQVLKRLKLLWQGPEARMSDDAHLQLYNYKQIYAMLEEDGSIKRELFFDQIQPVTKSEIEANELDEPLHIRGFGYQARKAEAISKQLKEEKANIKEQKKKLSAEKVEEFKAIEAHMAKEDEIPSDQLKTEDVTMTEEEVNSLSKWKNQRYNELVEEASDSDVIYEEISRMPGSWRTLERRDKTNLLTVNQMKRMEDLVQNKPEDLKELVKLVNECEQASEELSELESKYKFARKKRQWKPDYIKEKENAPETKLKEEFLFFEKRQQYFDFAQEVMRQDTSEMSKEEADIITEMQNKIRADQRLPDHGLEPDLFKKDFYFFNKLRPNKNFLHDIKHKSILKTPQLDSEMVVPDIPFDTILKTEKGTFEGTRRFERIDRVSLDLSKDSFDRLKLEGKQGRVYDFQAALESITNPKIMKASLSLSGHLEKSLIRVREKDEDDGRWKKIVTLDDGIKEIPEDLPSEDEGRWLERQEKIQFYNKIVNIDGNVDRDIYAEDWVHRNEGSQQIGVGSYDTEMHMVGTSGLKAELDAQYEQAKIIEAQILERRQEIAKKLKEQKDKLDQIYEGHENLRKKLVRINAANFEQQLAPGETQHDFLKDERLKRYSPARTQVTQTIEFSPESKNVADYEAELHQISQNGLHKTTDQRDNLLSQFEYVFDALNKNKIPITLLIRARMFEYLTIRNDIDQANTQLQRLTTDMTEKDSPVDIHYLRYHLNNCLKHDKIDGIAYLTNYFDRYQVDCSDMPLHRFHNMLDYYLNHNFDMSKVLIFCKFYRQYYTNLIRNGLEQVLNEGQKPGTMDDLQLKQLQNLVFSKNDSLIDMRSLAKFLVKKTGDKQIIDPKTGEDQFWSLVQMFTQSADVYQASSLAKNNHIEPETISEYFGNRLNQPNSLDRVMKVAVRLGDTKSGKEFSAKMLEQIKAYQTRRNGELPQSFTKGALKDLFAKLRPQREVLSANTSELLLYLMQQKGLHAEVIDYCDKLSKTELAKYYLTESLLHLPLKSGTYSGALEKANVFGADDKSAMNLTQKTKAIMLDKGPEAAYAYFQEEFGRMEEKAKKEKALLVSLYDMLMSGEKLEFQEFKDRYLHSSMLASRLAKESFVVNQMEKLLKDKDYDQVEAAFNLYAVMREERLLEKAEFLMNGKNPQEVTKLLNTNQAQKKQLLEVRKRRTELENKVGLRDTEICASIAAVLQDDLITVFNKAGADQIEKVASIFQDLTQEEAATIESRNHNLTESSFDESSVIADLESQGFERTKIKKLYDLLDFNAGKAYAKTSSQRREEQRKKYEALSEDDKKLFNKMQDSFRKNVNEIVRAKFTVSDALAIIRKVEADPANAGLKNMYYQDDYTHSDKSDPELIAAEEKYFPEERAKERRHQNQFIDKLQDQFRTLNIQRILNRDEGSEDTDPMSDLLEDEEITEAKAADALANDILGLKDINDEDLINQKLDEYAEKAGEEIDKALRNAGFLDKNGQLSPVLRASLLQGLIHLEEDERFRRLQEGTDIELTESDLDEEEFFGVFKYHNQTKINELGLRHRIGTKYAHPISDLSEQEDKNNPRDVMVDFWNTIDANVDFYLRDRVQEIVTPKMNREYIQGRIRRNYRTKWLYERFDKKPKMHIYPKLFNAKKRNAARMEQFRKSMLENPLGPRDMAEDPEVLQAEIYDATVYTLKEKLLYAINKRKYEALPLAIQVFNQIQGKKIGDRFRLEDFEQQNVHDFTILNEQKPMDVSGVEVKNIGQTMQKLDLLLNDNRSPIISTLIDTSKYKQNKLPENVIDYYKDSQSYTREPLDIGAYERDLQKLSILQDEIIRIEKTADFISDRVQNGINNVDGNLNEKVLSEKKAQVKHQKEKNNKRIRKIYEDFSAGFKQAEELDEHKVRVMRDVLALELGQSFNVNYDETKTASQFPVFYALDLINFGIKRKQPAAVRLGEKLLSESCPADQAKLPREMAMSVKNFMLDYDNNMQYREAMKLTGPINSSRIYHLANQQSNAQGITFCLDDPYWQEFTMKNRRREDQWRNPSVFAYRYKQYGILGEVMDMHSIQKKYDMAFSRPM